MKAPAAHESIIPGILWLAKECGILIGLVGYAVPCRTTLVKFYLNSMGFIFNRCSFLLYCICFLVSSLPYFSGSFVNVDKL